LIGNNEPELEETPKDFLERGYQDVLQEHCFMGTKIYVSALKTLLGLFSLPNVYKRDAVRAIRGFIKEKDGVNFDPIHD